MKIRNRLSLQFTLIVASILILFSGSIYFFSAAYRKNEFTGRLKEKALTTAKLFIEVDEVDSALLKIIDKNAVNILPHEDVIIFDSSKKEIYRSDDSDTEIFSPSILSKIKSKKEYNFQKAEFEYVGIFIHAREKDYTVIAKAEDLYGKSKLQYLRLILIVGLFASVFITLLSGWFFSGQALKPISKVVEEVDAITGDNLNQRVGEGNRKDEIAQLAMTFNLMLDRIEQAFQTQKSFIANASHELRTPLTAITGQIEVALINQRQIAEYENILASILDDIKKLNRLTNGLLLIAQSNMDINAMRMKTFRVDELLWESRQDIMKRNADYSILLHFPEMPTDESELCLTGIEPLFKTAITNLMDNACKYSLSKKVEVTLTHENNHLEITFEDEGIGIPFSEMEKIFEPFYRASNAQRYPGQGLGLSLARRTVELHRGQIVIQSVVNEGTTIRLEFPIAAA
ncbi:MAG: ATP-binding protein [Chitinophagales bacterium]